MQYRVNLAQADVINMNNRCYSKESLEQIRNQINEKTVVVVDESSDNQIIIGKTIKAEIVDGCLYADVALFKPTSAKFINLSILGSAEYDDTVKNLWIGGKAKGVLYTNKNDIQYYTSHHEVKNPKVNFLFVSNTNSFSKDNFKTSNFVKKQTTFINNE